MRFMALAVMVGMSSTAIAGEDLPVGYSDIGKNLNPVIAKMKMQDRIGKGNCDTKPENKRDVCTYKIGSYASILAAAQKGAIQADDVTVICAPPSPVDTMKCLSLYGALLQAAAPEGAGGSNGKIIGNLVSGLTVGEYAQIRTEEVHITMQKVVGTIWFTVTAADAPSK